jgi:hypothetical protein
VGIQFIDQNGEIISEAGDFDNSYCEEEVVLEVIERVIGVSYRLSEEEENDDDCLPKN